MAAWGNASAVQVQRTTLAGQKRLCNLRERIAVAVEKSKSRGAWAGRYSAWQGASGAGDVRRWPAIDSGGAASQNMARLWLPTLPL
jgi:hypothetical protein